MTTPWLHNQQKFCFYFLGSEFLLVTVLRVLIMQLVRNCIALGRCSDCCLYFSSKLASKKSEVLWWETSIFIETLYANDTFVFASIYYSVDFCCVSLALKRLSAFLFLALTFLGGWGGILFNCSFPPCDLRLTFVTSIVWCSLRQQSSFCAGCFLKTPV